MAISSSCFPLSTIFPSLTTRMMSAFLTVDILWAITMEVLPSMMVSMAFWIFCSIMVSTDAVASSSTSILACRQGVAALSYITVQSAGDVVNDLVRRAKLQRSHDLVFRGVGISVEQVLPDRAGEQVRRLLHVADR